MDLMLSGRFISVRDEQFLKQWSPIFCTESGIFINLSLVQSAKHSSFIEETEFGIFIS
jgi:hypothetical protein